MPDELHEVFISGFQDLEFTGFEQDTNRIIAYVDERDMNDSGREMLEQWLMAQREECYIASEELVKERNWNEEWEQTIKPQRIGRFVITPTWADPEISPDDIVLEIDPKMAFGTGYHETTRLMLRLLPEVIENGNHVLDAGTGSGVLAIAALKLGAARALGFDIDEWSYNNATENALLNHVSDRLVIKVGGAETLHNSGAYEVVLANINRNILMDMAEVLAKATKTGGQLLLSGIMREDEQVMLNYPAFKNFSHVESIYENEWVALWLRKNK